MAGRRKKLPAVVDMDRHVGERVRLRRNMLGMSQETLGDKIGLTFQQVQKYERGGNRVSASRLCQISQVLGVPIAFFYDARDPVRAEPVVEPVRAADDPLTRRESQELLAAYARLGARLQGNFLVLLRSLVAAAEEAKAPPAPAKRRQRAAAV